MVKVFILIMFVMQDKNQDLIMRKQQVFDSYGFRTTKIQLIIDSFHDDPDKHKERLKVWNQILNQGMFGQGQQNLVKQEVRNGIPDELRPKVWLNLITLPTKEYESIKIKQYLKEIDRDIDRTIPTNKRQSELKQKLRNTLNKLAVAFPEMGYCQGLNFIVANLLLILDQKQTYNVMFHILYWQHHEKLMSNMDNIHVKLYVLSQLIKKHYPKLSKCLGKWEIDPLQFASPWFITLFSSVMPCNYILRILEIYLLEGQKVLYRVALQILKKKKNILKKFSVLEDLNDELKSYKQFGKSSIDDFFRQMFEIKITRKQIEGYEAEFENQTQQQAKK